MYRIIVLPETKDATVVLKESGAISNTSKTKTIEFVEIH